MKLLSIIISSNLISSFNGAHKEGFKFSGRNSDGRRGGEEGYLCNSSRGKVDAKCLALPFSSANAYPG
jgi:hypothetical protein